MKGKLELKTTKADVKKVFKNIWKKEKLMILIGIGVLVGFLAGPLGNKKIRALPEPMRTDVQVGVEFLGRIFLQMLRQIILPLVLSSLIRGMASLSGESVGKVGLATFLYYGGTTVLSVALGIVLAVTIQPGKRANYVIVRDESIPASRPMDLFLDIVRNLFPDNIVQACFQSVKTTAVPVTEYKNVQQFNIGSNYSNWSMEEKMMFKSDLSIFNVTENGDGTFTAVNASSRTYYLPGATTYSNGTNMLGIITFGIVFGIICGRLKEKGKVLLDVLEAIETIMIQIIHIIMWFSPIGIACLIIGQFWKIDDVASIFAGLGIYFGTILAGLAIHLLITIQLIYFIVTRRNPLIYMKNMGKSILTAFATSSSYATLPITLQCLDENNKIDTKISRFMIPIGSTVNMDGTALYEGVAAIFLSQVYGKNLSVGEAILTSVAATLASVGAPGIPQGGLVTLVIVLQVLGLPPDSLGLVISIDWLVSRFRAVVNVTGDAFGCGVVQFLNDKYFSRGVIKNETNESESSISKEEFVDTSSSTNS